MLYMASAIYNIILGFSRKLNYIYKLVKYFHRNPTPKHNITAASSVCIVDLYIALTDLWSRKQTRLTH